MHILVHCILSAKLLLLIAPFSKGKYNFSDQKKFSKIFCIHSGGPL